MTSLWKGPVDIFILFCKREKLISHACLLDIIDLNTKHNSTNAPCSIRSAFDTEGLYEDYVM